MDKANQAYIELNKKWKGICKALLGDEIGELSEYAEWLYTGNGPRKVRKSSISGKPVVFSKQNYSQAVPCMALDEVDFEKKAAPLDLSKATDFGSLVAAVSGRVCYTGNMVLGNSKFVEGSTTVNDCFYVFHSERTAFSKYVAYSCRGGYSDNVFGCFGFGPAFFAIKSNGITDVTRCLGASKCEFSSDIYFSHGLTNCHDCIFCFNLKNKSHCIGNVQLTSEKYMILKKKLLGEMRQILQKEKKLPTLPQIIAGAKLDYVALTAAAAGMPSPPAEKSDKSQIEEAFSKTTKVLLGRQLSGIDKYAAFLSKNASCALQDVKSCLSGKPMKLADYSDFPSFPRERLLTQQEADFTGERLKLADAQVAGLSFANAGSALSKIAYFCPYWNTGTLKNNIDSPINLEAIDCYRGIIFIKSKLCGYCFSPRSCDYTFGSNEGRHLSFCINASFSAKLTRCFEVDACENCSDLYFSHNCENVHDSMFCFNVKNLRYAIGNVEAGREKYLEMKKMLLEEIGKKIEASGDFPLDIYNIGAPKRAK